MYFNEPTLRPIQKFVVVTFRNTVKDEVEIIADRIGWVK